jgi:hypothetical protein
MFFLSGMQTNSLTERNNGILTARKAMPQKDITSDGDSSFAMARQQYIKSEVKPSVLVKKKWYGASTIRDSTAVIDKRVKNQVGNGSLNANGGSIAFTSVKDVNTTRDALVRVRNIGSCVPAKKIHNYVNAPIFY